MSFLSMWLFSNNLYYNAVRIYMKKIPWAYVWEICVQHKYFYKLQSIQYTDVHLGTLTDID